MSDRHVRILAMIASRSQRRLDAQENSGPRNAGSAAREAELGRRAKSTRARLAAARARRRYGPTDEPGAGSADADTT